MTQALLLAAGMGSRLMPLTAHRPKVLVEVGGQPLLGRLLHACAGAGLERAVVVTGYRADVIAAWLDAAPPPLPVQLVHNAAYSTLGNAHSVRVAREALAGAAFVKFDGDVILDPAILAGLLAHPDGSAACLDKRGALDEEAMKATLDDHGRIAAFGKGLPLDTSAGESIGVEKIAAADGPMLFDALDDAIDARGMGQAYYEDVYDLCIKAGWRMGAYDIGDARWGEIDDARDLEAAEALVGAIG